MKVLIATRNKGKVAEIQFALQGFAAEIVGLDDAGVPSDFDVEEPAITFEGNAIIKAMVYGRRTGLLTLADDAGLAVDALGGRPGVLSARYAPGTDEDRYRKLLDEMADVPDEQRGAQFCAVVALYDPATERVRTCEGVYRGRILRQPRGSNGFGYDPIFLDEASGRALAELTAAEKLAVSHRGLALQKAKVVLARDFLK